MIDAKGACQKELSLQETIDPPDPVINQIDSAMVTTLTGSDVPGFIDGAGSLDSAAR